MIKGNYHDKCYHDNYRYTLAVSYKIVMIQPNETRLWVIYFRVKLVVFLVLPIAWLEDFTMSSQEELQQNFVMMAYLNEIKQMSKVKQLQNTLLVVVGVYQYDS